MTDEEFRSKRRQLWLERAQLQLKREKLALERARKDQRWLGTLATPLGAAVVAGVLALFGNAVTSALSVVSDRKQQQSDLIVKISEVQDEKQRSLNMLFFAEGGYLALSQDYRDYLRKTAGLNKDEVIPPPRLSPTEVVSIPDTINVHTTFASLAAVDSLLGPAPRCADDAREMPNGFIMQSVGPFRVTGLRPAVESVKRVFDQLRVSEPDLYRDIKFSGMFVCRSDMQRRLSKHNWGIAIDLHFGEVPDTRADGQTQAGVVRIAEYFQREGFFWAANAHGTVETAFHFEPSRELLIRWRATRAVQ